ncbi:MAG: tRNA (guanosine(37)-N1)-methyltransferase TrmD [Phycisphaerae bacterium]|nr:tRNA (guanosine(37)-N1)-methyltransferase TrmD [Phycisphaerae bacterium]
MQIDILSLFPNMFRSVFGESIIKRACNSELVEINLVDIRDYALDSHRSVDDKPYGGGPGMVMMCQPVFDCVKDVCSKGATPDEIILMTPQGVPFNQGLARELVAKRRLVLIAGHYEGFDERIREHLATMEISLGDFVLSGGEIPAMAITDALIRLIPGALGHAEATHEESFSENTLEYPQYTRPAVYRDLAVPEMLLSGHHGNIKQWRSEQALERTRQRRPDLLE